MCVCVCVGEPNFWDTAKIHRFVTIVPTVARDPPAVFVAVVRAKQLLIGAIALLLGLTGGNGGSVGPVGGWSFKIFKSRGKPSWG